MVALADYHKWKTERNLQDMETWLGKSEIASVNPAPPAAAAD